MAATESSRRIPSWLLLVGAMSALGPFSIDMYLPGFPAIEREFAETGVERTMATFMLGIAIGQIFYGPLSDRFGRKPPLYFGLALYAIGALGCALATNMTMLMMLRTLQAIGGCAPMVIARAVVRDRCEPQEAAQAYSTLMMIMALGPVVAPTLGGWLIGVSTWRAVFVFQALAGLAILVAMHRMLMESRDPAHVRPLHFGSVLRSYARLLANRTILGYSCVGGFAMASMFCFVAGSPIVMAQQYALTPQQFGWMIGLNGVAFMTASQLNIRSLRRSTPAQVLRKAIWLPFLTSASLAAVAFVSHVPLWALLVAQFWFFISVGRVNPNVPVLALAQHGAEAGTASALMGMVQSSLGVVAGTAVALLADDTLFTLATLMASFSLASVISYWLVARPR
jgi:MFS transporter, DHA1 family, multidrug resistance protein